jgi:hypothetical protein
MLLNVNRLSPPDEPSDDEEHRTPSPLGRFHAEGEDLPYKVEVWDEAGQFVEQVVAVSVSASIGYAAYYAATREYAGRAITLRHKGRVISRWAGHPH